MTNKRDFTVFEYQYRDAANFKAQGNILLAGTTSRKDHDALIQTLDSGEYFVAEQVEISVLYEILYTYSDGPTADDHAFHEFMEMRPATPNKIKTLTLWGSVTELMATFQEAKNKWDVRHSPHYYIS